MPHHFTTTNEADQLRELEAQAALARSFGITKPQPVTLPELPQNINTEFTACFHEVSTEAAKATNHTAITTPHINHSPLLTAGANQEGGTAEPRRVVLDAHRVILVDEGRYVPGKTQALTPLEELAPHQQLASFGVGVMEGRGAPEG